MRTLSTDVSPAYSTRQSTGRGGTGSWEEVVDLHMADI